jgi:hypothetical protein
MFTVTNMAYLQVVPVLKIALKWIVLPATIPMKMKEANPKISILNAFLAIRNPIIPVKMSINKPTPQ